jgi:hypothetical protein
MGRCQFRQLSKRLRIAYGVPARRTRRHADWIVVRNNSSPTRTLDSVLAPLGASAPRYLRYSCQTIFRLFRFREGSAVSAHCPRGFARRVGGAFHGSSGQGCFGYRPFRSFFTSGYPLFQNPFKSCVICTGLRAGDSR